MSPTSRATWFIPTSRARVVTTATSVAVHVRPREPERGCRCTTASVEGRPRDEDGLVERARRGDTAAYEELVHRYQGIAFRTAYVVAGSASDAEDAAQEAFVKAYRALGRFRPGAPFRPWLLQIVVNEARNRRRSAGRRGGLELRPAAERPSGGAAPVPQAALVESGRRAELPAEAGKASGRGKV